MSILAFFGILFVLLPLPLCIILLVKRSKDVDRIQNLERRLSKIEAVDETEGQVAPTPSTPAPDTSAIQPKPFTRGESNADRPVKDSARARHPSLEESSSPVADRMESAIPTPEGNAKSPSPNRVANTLRSIGLWPPETSASAEAGLMQWWLPRIGGLLATLAVISFAVYISQGTPSWVRFLELLFADAAVIGTGIFFLKRRPKFGITLVSTGLSMLYLTSIAAYAAPPVRVIANPFVGIAAQFAVVVAVFASSLRLANRNIAIMALVYGFASSLYSAYAGLLEPSLISALALYATGIAFSRKFGLLPILSISSIGAYAPILSFCILESIGSSTITLPHSWSALAHLLISVSLLPLCEARWRLSESAAPFKRLHLLNTSLFFTIGSLYMGFFTNDLVSFYGLGAIVFGSWALVFSRRGLSHFVFQIFFLKAVALAALWFVYRYDEFRWFALIVEAALVAWIAVRSRSILQEIASITLWIISLAYVLTDLLGPPQLKIASFEWFLFLAHPLLSTAVLAYFAESRRQTGRSARLYIAAALINGLASVAIIRDSETTGDSIPAFTALFGAAICLIGIAPRFSKSIPAIVGAVPILAANIHFWIQPYSDIAFAASAVAAFGFGWAVARRVRFGESILRPTIEFVFHFAWITTVFAFAANAFQSESYFIYFPALFSIALLTLPGASLTTLRDASLAPLFLYAITAQSSSSNLIINALAIVAYLAVLYLPNFRPKLIRSFRLFRRWRLWRTLQHWLVALIALRIVFYLDSWIERLLAMVALSVAFHILWRLHRRFVALVFSLFYAAACLAMILSVWDASLGSPIAPQPWAREALLGGLLTGALAIGLGIDHNRASRRRLRTPATQLLVYAFAGLSFLSVALTLSADLVWNPSSYTPLMAFFCLVLIGIGIGAKVKPFRIVALAGFLLPLVRLFVYDIRDTLVRIAAFAILSAFITFIGYLYHRFQSRID